MKLTKEQLEEIIEVVLDYTEYDIEINGPQDYDITGFVVAANKKQLFTDVEATLNKLDLQDLFDLQTTFQLLAGYSIKTINFIRLSFIGIITEACEALEETNWKPWKKPQDKDEEKFKEEIVDIWHFLINLTLASGMNAEELMRRFKSKNSINTRRHKEKY